MEGRNGYFGGRPFVAVLSQAASDSVRKVATNSPIDFFIVYPPKIKKVCLNERHTEKMGSLIVATPNGNCCQ